MLEEHLSEQLLGGFFRVYRDLGFGFLEPVYKNSLLIELQHCGVDAKLEVLIEVFYRGKPVGKYRVDLLVGGKIIVEVKATKAVCEADERQLLNYLKATSAEVGFLLHFGQSHGFPE